MPVMIGSVEAVLKLRDTFTAQMKIAGEEVQSFAKKTTAAMTRQRSALPLLAGAGVAFALAGRSVVKALEEQEHATALVAQGVKNAADTFGLSANQIQQYAADLQRSTGQNDEAIMQSAAVLLSFRRVQGDVFKEALKQGLNMSTVLGTDLKNVMIQLGKALEDPIKGVTALSRSGTTFTAQQKDQIKTLVESNRLLDAQKLILTEIKSQYDGAAEAARNTLGGALRALRNEWGDLLETVGQESEGGSLRTAVESWIGWIREFKDFLPQLGIAWYSMLEGMASGLSSWIKSSALQLAKSAASWSAAFAELPSILPGAEKLATGFAAVSMAISQSALDVTDPIDLFAEGMGIKAKQAMDSWMAGAKDVVAAGGALDTSLGEDAEAAEKLADAYAALRGSLDPGIKALNEFNAGLKVLDAAWKAGKIGPEEYDDVLRQLTTTFNDAAAAAENLKHPLEAVAKIDLLPVTSAAERLTKVGAISISMSGLETAKAAVEGYLETQGKIRTEQEAINILVKLFGVPLEEATKLVKGLAEETKGAASEWDEFLKSSRENFVRGAQQAFVDFFSTVAEGGGNAIEKLGDALLGLIKDFAAQFLAHWAMVLVKKLTMTKAEIAAEAAAQKALSAGGGAGGATSSNYSSMLSGAGGYVAAAFAVVAAVAALTHAYKVNQDKKTYGTGAGGKVDDGAMYFGWSGKLNETGAKVAAGIQGLLQDFQEATGAFVTGLSQAQIRIRNDKKSFVATVNDVVIGNFKTAEEAIIAAAKRMFLDADLSSALDPIVRQVIENYAGKDPAEFGAAVNKVQGIMDSLSGLTEIEISLRNLPAQAQALSGELRGMGVALQDAQSVAARWQVQQMSNLRDQITGHQKTAAEEMAERQRQATMFNAQLALMRAELEMKKQELIAKSQIVRADGEILQREFDIERAGHEGRVNILRARAGLYNEELEMAGEFAGGLGEILGAAGQTFAAEIAAIQAILDSLPTAIDFKEIKLGGRGGGGVGGGVSSGPSKEDRRKSAQEELESLADQLLPALVSQSRAMTEQFEELRAEMVALGMSTEQLDALEAAHRAQLQQQAMAEVAQYTQSPYQLALADILAWGADMSAVYAELGLSLAEVQEAEEARLEALIAQAEAAAGMPGVDQQWKDMADALAFLKSQLDAGKISAEEYADAVAAAGNKATMALVDSLSGFAESEAEKLAMEQLRWQMEIANIMLQFEYIKSLNILTAEQLALIQGLIDKAKEAGPPTGEGGAGGLGKQGWTVHDVGGGGSDLVKTLQDLAKALREWVDSVKQDTSVSPYTLGQRFALAQQEYLQTLAVAQGNPELEATQEAIRHLPDVAQDYLELAAEMFGTASAGYQELFQSVVAAVEALAVSLETVDDWRDLRERLAQFHTQFSSMVYELRAIDEVLGGDPPLGGGPEMEKAADLSMPTARYLGMDRLEEAVRAGAYHVADEVCRTGDATATELRAIRKAVEKPSLAGAAERRAAASRDGRRVA